MAKQCCNCNKKLNFLDSGFEIGSRKQNYLCERCHLEKRNLYSARNEGELKEKLKHFSRILNGEVVLPDVRDELCTISRQVINQLKKTQEMSKISKERELETMLEIKKNGYHFATDTRTIFESYTSNITVNKHKVVITRTGNTTLPSESTIYFNDATAVSWGNSVGRSWISFTVPGAANSGNNVFLTSGKMTIGLSSSEIPYDDAFSVVFGMHQEDDARKHFIIIKKLFDEYKENKHTSPNPVASNQVEGAIDKLKKLKELKELGIISEDEYEEKRVKLFSEI